MDFCFAMTYNPIELPPIRFSTRSPEAAAADSPKGRKKGRKSTTIATTTTTTHSPHSLSPKPPLKKKRRARPFPKLHYPFCCLHIYVYGGGSRERRIYRSPVGKWKAAGRSSMIEKGVSRKSTIQPRKKPWQLLQGQNKAGSSPFVPRSAAAAAWTPFGRCRRQCLWTSCPGADLMLLRLLLTWKPPPRPQSQRRPGRGGLGWVWGRRGVFYFGRTVMWEQNLDCGEREQNRLANTQ